MTIVFWLLFLPCAVTIAEDSKANGSAMTPVRSEEQTRWIGLAKDGVTIVGGILGAIAFLWRVFDARKRFLHVELTVSQENGNAIAETIVENKGSQSKVIDNSLLLVGPENENPIDTAKALLPHQKIETTNDLEKVVLESATFGMEGRAIIPVDFYYSENVNIADERIGYGVPLDVSQIPAGTPYAVRFYIFAEKHLHRSTEATFVLPSGHCNTNKPSGG